MLNVLRRRRQAVDTPTVAFAQAKVNLARTPKQRRRANKKLARAGGR